MPAREVYNRVINSIDVLKNLARSFGKASTEKDALGMLSSYMETEPASKLGAFETKPYRLHKLDSGPSALALVSKEEASNFYRAMTIIRAIETATDNLYKDKAIRGFCHLYSGQEAVAVGVRSALRPHDCVITAYRAHAWTYLMGVPVLNVLAELMGRKSGCARGKGGSMHMYGHNFYGGNGIVGAQICGKRLKCGQPSSPHTCDRPCHEGDCPPCFQTTLVRCRCGHMDKELPCQELTTKADDARCEKKCTKKRLCGKHRCNQRCCIELEHFCPLPCNHTLNCGQHRCERTCHSGRCPPCIETSFDELYCECGASVLYPPVPCGTRPPACNSSCSRARPCGHEVNHTCHTGACPPCTVLCKRWCYGKHEQRSAIPCYQEDFSCGRPCGQQMPCGTHKCDKPCHLGPCPLPCRQKCTIKRTQCGHPCGAPCHQAPCPNTVCKFNVPVTCQCGLQKATRPCIELADEYKELEMQSLKEKMSDLLKDQSIDITDIINKPKKMAVLKILECNEECKVLERNRRLAIGLQIRNPDLSQKLTPRYSDFMRGWAKKDSKFCQKIHDKLSELVQLAKQSKQKSRSLSFESMNRDKRHFVHEYCEHFGCESAAYDQEPNRNIVATAFKDKSWLPSMSLTEVIQRENGQRKVPGPMLTSSGAAVGKSETVALKLPGRLTKTSTPPEELVDYFDNPPT